MLARTRRADMSEEFPQAPSKVAPGVEPPLPRLWRDVPHPPPLAPSAGKTIDSLLRSLPHQASGPSLPLGSGNAYPPPVRTASPRVGVSPSSGSTPRAISPRPPAEEVPQGPRRRPLQQLRSASAGKAASASPIADGSAVHAREALRHTVPPAPLSARSRTQQLQPVQHPPRPEQRGAPGTRRRQSADECNPPISAREPSAHAAGTGAAAARSRSASAGSRRGGSRGSDQAEPSNEPDDNVITDVNTSEPKASVPRASAGPPPYMSLRAQAEASVTAMIAEMEREAVEALDAAENTDPVAAARENESAPESGTATAVVEEMAREQAMWEAKTAQLLATSCSSTASLGPAPIGAKTACIAISELNRNSSTAAITAVEAVSSYAAEERFTAERNAAEGGRLYVRDESDMEEGSGRIAAALAAAGLDTCLFENEVSNSADATSELTARRRPQSAQQRWAAACLRRKRGQISRSGTPCGASERSCASSQPLLPEVLPEDLASTACSDALLVANGAAGAGAAAAAPAPRVAAAEAEGS
eukprot:TRINITY_DN1553_c0_g2_i1.p1 TRINITY_DN1553_c0_g2~~TRINITY_DN1553_c0_g2_i1.p1  ORF type:complete len:533 (-),score=90.09 TRINITY_DN1553_c0_g2_i1:229-1827(-)